jgi:serine/threonine-protein kinase RIO1
MINKGFLKEIHGCISQGKEARVYHAIGGTHLDCISSQKHLLFFLIHVSFLEIE